MSQNNDRKSGTNLVYIYELTLILKSYKWVLLGTIFLVTLLTWVISSFFIVPKYQASSYISVREPFLRAELDSRLIVNQSVPDTASLPNLAEAKSLVYLALENEGLSEIYHDELPEMKASLQGNDQIRLEVRARTPEYALAIANSWAQVFVNRLNDIYGTGETSLENIEEEVHQSKAIWLNAQNELQEYLPNNRVNELEVQLTNKKTELDSCLMDYYLNRKIILDCKVYQDQISEYSSNERLELGYYLSLIALQQRISGGISGNQFEFSLDKIGLEEFTVEDARRELSSMIISLENQNFQLLSEIDDINNDIREITVDLETERHKLESLTEERDLARSTYLALSNQLVETKITQSQSSNKAQIVANAEMPRDRISPNILINVGLAAFLGFLVSLSGILIYDWYLVQKS